MKWLIMAVAAMALTGCTVSQQTAQGLSAKNAYGCATSGGVEYLGIWTQYDIHNYCRDRVAQLEKSGKMLDVDKDAAMHDVYGG